MRSGRAALLAVAATWTSCGGDTTPVPVDAVLQDGAPAQFAIRGRWPDPMRLGYRIDPANSPMGEAAFADAVRRAIALWNATAVVRMQPAADRQPADVTLSWRRGHHGACEPFGPNADVAHTGPVATGTFVHFDLGRTWSVDATDATDSTSLFGTALHELGHVLGLGHSEAVTAVMSTEKARPLALSPHDLAGLYSLYGGGQNGPGDLRIVRTDGTAVAILRQVAPASTCAFAVFDSDGDGDDELLVWRTDTPGHGALMAFHFAPAARLARTLGPFHGAVAPGADVRFVVAPNGERLIVCEFANARRVVRQFDGHGVPGLPTVEAPTDVLARATRNTRGDLDGDGTIEEVVAAARN